MKNWTDSLPSLDIGTMKPVFSQLAGHEIDAARPPCRRSANDPPRRQNGFCSTPDGEPTPWSTLAVPDPGESLPPSHSQAVQPLARGAGRRYTLAAPATINHLTVATLGFKPAEPRRGVAVPRQQAPSARWTFYFRCISRRSKRNMRTVGARVDNPWSARGCDAYTREGAGLGGNDGRPRLRGGERRKLAILFVD